MEVLSRYGPLVDDPAELRAAMARPLPTVVRVNTIKADVDRVTATFDAAGIGWTRRAWTPRLLELDVDDPGNTWPGFLGWTYSQEEVSAIPATVLDPSPGDVVWDACAAPGSKATQLGALLDESGLVVANDADLGRLAPLRFNAERLGVTNLAVTNQDAAVFSLEAFEFDAFDAALVDAPCSGEGILRRNPGAVDDWSEAMLEGLSGTQTGILRRAVQATRHGGRVVYSTCTFAPEENEAVLDRVLADGTCRVVPFESPISGSEGVTSWRGRDFDPSVRHARRYWPHENDTGGFFCALLEVTA